MSATKNPPITIGMILMLLTAASLLFAACECRAQDAAPTVQTSPSPVPTPADDATAEEVYEYILEQPDCESWTDSNYDPVTTRNGECIVPKDEIYQSASAGLAVVCTHGYENHYYDDGSGDIRGLWHQGFIDIEGTEVAFRIMDLFVSTAWAKNDKWKKVKAIKKLSKIQIKPKKPKKVKWKKDDGLKEKKEKFNNEKSP